jgi:hypothetical protein
MNTALDCLHDHILPTDILRQMALDASEGEQKLEHTESNREHLWRILQGGELIAPIPPLPPRETPPLPNGSPVPAPNPAETSNGLAPSGTVAPPPDAEQARSVKKIRSRKKVEAMPQEQEPASVIQASDATPEVAPKPARGRRKRTAESDIEAAGALDALNGNAPSTPTSSETVVTPAKPKRTRRVGEPKPKRYPVGEQGTEQGVS